VSDRLARFWDGVGFEPDDYQVEAAEAVRDGASVVVTAPTGAGKTLIAEAAIHLALEEGRRAFYTTPIKALSNQKHADLARQHGEERVGLLTGDNVVRPDAPVIVATLEVLRNMIYADPSRLSGVSVVILDEAHYLQDLSRGAGWEEVIIHCPKHIRLVCLSATISNNTQFADWVRSRRGDTRLVASDERPAPLESLYMIKDKMGDRDAHLLPTFVARDGRRSPNPKIKHMLGLERGGRRRFRAPSRVEVVETLARESMLPAIYFIFSRAGCDAAARRLVEVGARLASEDDRATIAEVAEARTSHLSDGDLAVLGYESWMVALCSGVASHHAGLAPAFKETVEELFAMGLIKVVFATETLALGINMPARSVVLESLSKFNGETHAALRPGDYTQLTGRAGRRGIDAEGFGVVLHSPFVPFNQVTEIASAGSHELRSGFRPTYNMTANLIGAYSQDEARTLLRASFAAYQRKDEDASAVSAMEALERELARDEKLAECELGSVEGYLAEIEAIGAQSPRRAAEAPLSVGAVIDVIGGARDGRYAVLKKLAPKNGAIRYLVLSTSGRVSTLGHRQMRGDSRVSGEIELPVPFKPRDRRFTQETLRRLRKAPAKADPRSSRARVSHPVAACPDAARHVEALRRAARAGRRLERRQAQRPGAGRGLIEELEAIRLLLEGLDYVSGWSLTARGERLRRIHNETDLLLAESVERGFLYGLAPPELAAIVSVFVYEPRTDEASPPQWPTPALDSRWRQIESLWKELTESEKRLRLRPTRRPDPGFGPLTLKWASGASFDDLPTGGMAPGDFVRVSRQLADLLRQLRDGVRELKGDAADALKRVDRGVVAAQGAP